MAFECVLVTPEQQVLDESVTRVILPAFDGLMGIETGRAPLLAKLGIGPLRVDTPTQGSRFFLIEGGVAQMKDGRLTILTQKSTAATELDAADARAAYAEAAARRVTDDTSNRQRQDDLERARVAERLATKS